MEYVVETQIRAMDNVIDLNYYSVPFAEVTNKKYRAIGLGTSGYHHMLANNKIHWNEEKHLEMDVYCCKHDRNYIQLSGVCNRGFLCK